MIALSIAAFPTGEAAAQRSGPSGVSSSADEAAALPAMPTGFPRVFLDCQGNLPCDRNHFRTEIRFVNWVLDRQDADVHVIATREGAGGGGSRFTLDFIGRGGMAHLADRLTYITRGTDVYAEERDGITQILRLGLVRYAVEAGLHDVFDVRFELDDEADSPNGALTEPHDPWNSWTFRVGLSGNADMRERSTRMDLNPSFSAERITEEWKVGFEMELNAVRSERELSGGRVVRDDRDEWEVDALVVRSVSDHISVGSVLGGRSSVSQNQDARVNFTPAIEFNYFPYSMANRRQLIARYAGGVQYSDYREETIFMVTEEFRPRHTLSVRYNAREAWGNAGIGAGMNQYLHDMDLYRVFINGNANFRVTRGINLTLSGNASWVQDEIHVPLSELSDEDILLGRGNLPSNYRYGGRIGLSYRFGSPFTNIVNTRFPN